MPIDLYCGVGEKKWNYHPVAPGILSCVSPVRGNQKDNPLSLPDDTETLVDSGTFNDPTDKRLTPKQALERQLAHIKKYKYFRTVRKLASYDLLIDEKWSAGIRIKQRWSENDAKYAIQETVNAARFLSNHRPYLTNNIDLVLSAQGVTSNQYLDCIQRISPFFNQTDILGLGGWCILGKMRRRWMPTFLDTIIDIIPFVAKEQFTNQIHIWGVIYPGALGVLLWMCNQYGLTLSTDSVGPQLRPCLGEWGYGDWRKKDYKRVSTNLRGLERKKHLDLTRKWLTSFENTQYYIPPWEHNYYKHIRQLVLKGF